MQVLCIISLIPANLTLIIRNGIPAVHSEILVEKIQYFIHNRSSITLFWSEPNKQNVTWRSAIIFPWSVSYTSSSTRLHSDSFTAGGTPAHVNMLVILFLWSWFTEWKAATNNEFFYIIHYSFFSLLSPFLSWSLANEMSEKNSQRSADVTWRENLESAQKYQISR